MSDLQARQPRPATGPMKHYQAPKPPPGREFRPEPIKPVQKEKKAMQKEQQPLSQNARMVLTQLDLNGPATGAELAKATGLSQGSVSVALKALREAGEVTSKKTGLNGGAILNTSTAWAMLDSEVEVKRRKDAERFDEERADAVGRNDAVGYPDTENDLEDDEGLPPAAVADHPDNDCDSGAAMAASNDPEKPDGSAAEDNAYLARRALAMVERCIGRMETASAGIQPLPEQDDRVTALRRLVPLVSDDIGAALTDVLDRVTGS